MGKIKNLHIETSEQTEGLDDLSYLVFQITSRLNSLLEDHTIPSELQIKIKTLSSDLMSFSGLESRQKL